MPDVTQILEAIESGDARAASELLPLVYGELRRLAEHRMANESPDHTLEPTALVHEAYIRLVGNTDPGWQNRGHFFAAAAEAMRRILIDHARRKGGIRHGGGHQRVALHDDIAQRPDGREDVLKLDEALARLAEEDPAAAELVKLRCFAGLTLGDAARMLGIGRRSADRLWAYARAWLRVELRRDDGDGV
jgi:RNA polymerase sigma factor (TIGR02999 family)